MARSRSGTRGRRGPRKPPRRAGVHARRRSRSSTRRERGAVELPGTITVKELAELLGTSSGGHHPRAHQERHLRDHQPADRPRHRVARRRGAGLRGRRGHGRRRATRTRRAARPAEAAKEQLWDEAAEDEDELVARAPIVTVMGHVDHGKTSLLDAIRSTTVAAGERGGITQHIGASEVTTKDGKRLVFLDTPGHEAFTSMRARGARVTDIAVIVVAADDGVMPQTLEAISHAKAAKVPLVIAMNKIDKPGRQPGPGQDRARRGRRRGRGLRRRHAAWCPVSAKTGQGIDELLEIILLVADLQELKANPKRDAVGTVIEARLDKGRGPVATIIVQTGTLRVGDSVVAGNTYGKIKALENSAGKRIPKAGPATAAVILGLDDVPEAGDVLRVVKDVMTARDQVESRKNAAAAAGRRRLRPGDPRGPVQADPGRPGQGAADHPQGRRVGLAGRDQPRAPAAVGRRGQDQRPARGRGRHHRQRHHARRRRRTRSWSGSTPGSPRRPAGRPRPRASTSASTTSSTSSRTTSTRPSRACSSRRSWRSSRAAPRSARSSGWARARSSPAASSPTGGSSAPAAPGSTAAASSSPRTRSTRSGGSATTSARSPRTSSAASASPGSTTSRRATSSSASPSRRGRRVTGLARPMSQTQRSASTSCSARRSARSSPRRSRTRGSGSRRSPTSRPRRTSATRRSG